MGSVAHTAQLDDAEDEDVRLAAAMKDADQLAEKGTGVKGTPV